jgi:hypothetical protein
METSEWLSMSSKQEYLRKMRWRYARAQGRRYKSRLIEELIAVCGYSRKHAIALLNGRGGPRLLKRSGPRPIYPPEQVRLVLKRIWFGSDQLCGKRLKAALPDWLLHYEKEYGPLCLALKEKLEKISAATIDRLLSPGRSESGSNLKGVLPKSEVLKRK